MTLLTFPLIICLTIVLQLYKIISADCLFIIDVLPCIYASPFWNEMNSVALLSLLPSKVCLHCAISSVVVQQVYTERRDHSSPLAHNYVNPPVFNSNTLFYPSKKPVSCKGKSVSLVPPPQCLNYVCDNLCGATGAVLPLHLALHYI